jgi:hypothetical protein
MRGAGSYVSKGKGYQCHVKIKKQLSLQIVRQELDTRPTIVEGSKAMMYQSLCPLIAGPLKT